MYHFRILEHPPPKSRALVPFVVHELGSPLPSITRLRRPCLSHHIGRSPIVAAFQIGALVGSYWSFIPGNHPLWLKIICFSAENISFSVEIIRCPRKEGRWCATPGQLLGRAESMAAPSYHFEGSGTVPRYCIAWYSMVLHWMVLHGIEEVGGLCWGERPPGSDLK